MNTAHTNGAVNSPEGEGVIVRDDATARETGKQRRARVLSETARSVWPDNTAKHLAQTLGCCVSMARALLSGERVLSNDKLECLAHTNGFGMPFVRAYLGFPPEPDTSAILSHLNEIKRLAQQ